MDGELTFEEEQDLLKRDTRHFAKRQITWFKRERDVIWLEKERYDHQETAILDKMISVLEEKGIAHELQ